MTYSYCDPARLIHSWRVKKYYIAKVLRVLMSMVTEKSPLDYRPMDEYSVGFGIQEGDICFCGEYIWTVPITRAKEWVSDSVLSTGIVQYAMSPDSRVPACRATERYIPSDQPLQVTYNPKWSIIRKNKANHHVDQKIDL